MLLSSLWSPSIESAIGSFIMLSAFCDEIAASLSLGIAALRSICSSASSMSLLPGREGGDSICSESFSSISADEALTGSSPFLSVSLVCFTPSVCNTSFFKFLSSLSSFFCASIAISTRDLGLKSCFFLVGASSDFL